MLGIRSKPDEEERLSRHAGQIGRGKSVIPPEWIIQRLDRESTDGKMARQARCLHATDQNREWHDAQFTE